MSYVNFVLTKKKIIYGWYSKENGKGIRPYLMTKKKKKTMKYKGRSYEETGIKRATSQKRISKMARVSSSLNVKGLKALFKRLGLFLRLIEKI